MGKYLFAIAIVTGIGFGLVRVLGPSVEPKTSVDDSSKVSTSTRVSYEFYELLEEDEVVVPESKYRSTPKTANLDHPTLLQIAAVKEVVKAEDLVERFRKTGLTVGMVERNQWWLIRSEPFTTYEQLKRAISTVERLNFHPIQIEVK